MICSKGSHEVINSEWKSGETYEGLDRHHNPPEFMFKEKEEWFGEMLLLCRKHHVELHREIKKILHKNSNRGTFVNSEFWLMQSMSENQILKAREEVYNFTKEWIKKDDTTTT